MSDNATAFDRAMHFLELPEVQATKPTTIVESNALFGHTGTHIVRTARHREEGWRVFLQVLDISEGGVTQVILPNKVCEAIYRQKQALIDRARRKPTPKLTREERDRLRVLDARRVLREARKNGRV